MPTFPTDVKILTNLKLSNKLKILLYKLQNIFYRFSIKINIEITTWMIRINCQ